MLLAGWVNISGSCAMVNDSARRVWTSCHCPALHPPFTAAIRLPCMRGLKFACADLTRIISSLGLLEIHHHFCKLRLEFTRQHHAGFCWWHLPGFGFVQVFPTLRTPNIPNFQQSRLPQHSTQANSRLAHSSFHWRWSLITPSLICSRESGRRNWWSIWKRN